MKRQRKSTLVKSSAAPAQPNRSLIDGLTALTALAQSNQPMSNLELCRRLGIETTRGNRLLKSLACVGFARQTSDRKYMIGPAMDVLAAQSLMQPRRSEHLLPVLRKLRKTGLDVAYGTLWQRHVVYLYFASADESKTERSFSLEADHLFPAIRSSVGHVLLAALPAQYAKDQCAADEQIETYRGGLKGLLADLQLTRQRGYAELTPAQTRVATSIAFPVGDPVYAAVALAGPARLHTAETKAALREAAAALSRGS